MFFRTIFLRCCEKLSWNFGFLKWLSVCEEELCCMGLVGIRWDIFLHHFTPDASVICLYFLDSTAILHVSALEVVTIHVISAQASWRSEMAAAQGLSQPHNRMRPLCLVLYEAPECSYMFIPHLPFHNLSSESLSRFPLCWIPLFVSISWAFLSSISVALSFLHESRVSKISLQRVAILLLIPEVLV
jgi:hypothetical protein